MFNNRCGAPKNIATTPDVSTEKEPPRSVSWLCGGQYTGFRWRKEGSGIVKITRIRGIYNKALYLKQRTSMMQSWSDYLDGLKSGAKVIPLRKQA